MELAGTWRALIAGDELRRTWLERNDDDDWEPVVVPGHWRSMPAFAGDRRSPAYRIRFDHPRDRTRTLGSWLVLDGLFYQGDVWLDGAYVGDTEGYFFPHDFEVTDALRAADRARPRHRGRLRPARPTSPPSATSPGCSSTGTASTPTGTPAASGDRCGSSRPDRCASGALRVVCRGGRRRRTPMVAVRAVLDAAERHRP